MMKRGCESGVMGPCIDWCLSDCTSEPGGRSHFGGCRCGPIDCASGPTSVVAPLSHSLHAHPKTSLADPHHLRQAVHRVTGRRRACPLTETMLLADARVVLQDIQARHFLVQPSHRAPVCVEAHFILRCYLVALKIRVHPIH